MTNVVYALMVRDLASGIERTRLDDGLAGVITIPDPNTITPIEPTPDNIGPVIPNARNMEELREMWGRNPSAIQEKLVLDKELKNLPRQRPGAN